MIFKEYSLEGKTAIVTGAGRGIGKGIALTLAEAGANITLATRTVEQLENTAKEIRKLGRRALVVPTDVIEKKHDRKPERDDLDASCIYRWPGWV